MKRDKAVVAALLGACAVLAGELVTFVISMLGPEPHYCDDFQIDSVIATAGRFNWAIGALVDLIAGGIVGVLMYYALIKLNKEFILFKAVFFSLVSWLIITAFVAAFFEGTRMDFRPFGDYACHIAGALANGVALGLLFKWVLFRKGHEKAE